ncbi:MAG: putative DNA-binding domain-containing protein [Lysobacter sp.]|nr:putative DNA-binding domain-containing protein [Lysobacter sp.]
MTGTGALARLQAAFASAVTGGDEAAVAAQLAGDPALARRRLAIYREAIGANRRGALRSAYPVVARLVGEAFFDEAARRLADSAPPACADLNRYGDGFPAFLTTYPHAGQMPWLADVARLEWAWHEALSAADAPGIDFAALAAVPAEEEPALRFSLHPSVRLVSSAWPVLAIWEANQPERDGAPDRDEGADDVLLWREDGRVRMALLDPLDAAFVAAIGRGIPLEEAAGSEGWNFAPMLARLAEHGLLAGFAGPPSGG